MTMSITIQRNIHFERRGRGSRKDVCEGKPPAVAAPLPGRVPRLARFMALAIRFDQLIRAGQVPACCPGSHHSIRRPSPGKKLWSRLRNGRSRI
jgi:hypothetical protein